MKSKDFKIVAAVIPVVMSILVLVNNLIFFIIHIETVKQLSKEPKTEELVKIIEHHLNYNDYSAISTIIGLFAIVVSVWVSLSIYNIIEKKNVEKTEENLENISKNVLALQNDYSAFNIESLGYIKVWEDRINNYYVDRIVEIVKETDYPLYLIATSMVRIENLLTAIVERFTSEAYYQMKEYLDLFNKELQSLSSKINVICEKHINSQENIDVLKSYLNCRCGEYNYYLHFREKNIGKPNAYYILLEACEYFKIAANLCPEANKRANGYIDNALAYLYYNAFLYNKNRNKSEAEKYIKLAYEYGGEATSYDSHYYRNYRNYGVIIENYSSYVKLIDYSRALEIAYKQYEKAFECNKSDYNTLISLASCTLKQLDLKNNIAVRSDQNDYFPLKNIEFNIDEDEVSRVKRCYDYLLQACQINALDERAHYHLIHILMYFFVIKNQSPDSIFSSKEEIIEKVKSEVGLCETIFYGKSPNAKLPFLFKSRNFFETIGDLEKAKFYNDMILDINKCGDSIYWDKKINQS